VALLHVVACDKEAPIFERLLTADWRKGPPSQSKQAFQQLVFHTRFSLQGLAQALFTASWRWHLAEWEM